MADRFRWFITSEMKQARCSGGSHSCTCAPLKPGDYTSIVPMGSLDPAAGHTFPMDHIQFVYADPNAYPPLYEVMAPASGIITRIDYYQRDWPDGSGHSGKYDDYRVVITHTNTFKSWFSHISELGDWVLEQAGELKPNDFTQVSISVDAGDVIGKAGGRPNAEHTSGMGVVDEDITPNFIHPERYDQFLTTHAACPLDYFEKSLKETLYQKVERTAEPRGGKFDFDQLGKLVGNWFLEGITDPLVEWEKHLSFVYDNIDPSQIRVGVGGTLPITNTVYSVVGNAPEPADVSAESGVVTYQLEGTAEFGEQELTATIIVQVMDAEKTKVEAFEGHPPNPEFTSNAKYYIR